MSTFEDAIRFSLANPEWALDELDKADCEESLLAFTRRHWSTLEPNTPFVEGWALEAVCEHLEAVTYGDIQKLLLNVPPGFMKSLLTNVFWPAWEWGPKRMPHLRYVAFSYTSSLTERDNRRFRDLLISPTYQRLWGDRFELRKIGEELVSNASTGWKLASSVGGVGTGERADRILCLPYNQRILTDKGWISVGDIVEYRYDLKVLGADAYGAVQWQAIEKYEKNPGRELVQIEFDGSTVRCTADHRVFVVGRGYVAASTINEGETVWTFGLDSLPPLRSDDLRQTEPNCQTEVLFEAVSECGRAQDIEDREQPSMYGLPDAGISAAIPSGAYAERDILLQQMPWRLQRGEKQPGLSNRPSASILQVVREGIPEQTRQGSQIRNMFVCLCDILKVATKQVRAQLGSVAAVLQLWERISTLIAYRFGGEVLLAPMFGGAAFQADARREERPLYARRSSEALSSRLDAHVQGQDQRAGQQYLPALPFAASSGRAELSRPSYRLCERELGRGQSDNALQVLPRADARFEGTEGFVGTAIVRAVKPAGYAEVTYNVRVGPHHNYSVEGLIAHNCDDPHNVKESESDTVRQETVRWFRESMSTRLNNMEKSAIVVDMQRVHESDVSGTIIESAQDYEHLMIPMEWDGRRYTTSIGWTDPREIDGELAWPERFSAKTVRLLKDILGPFGYPAQCQQLPSPRGGGIFIRDWWQLWGNPDDPMDPQFKKFPSCEYIIGSLDTAYTEKTENDYSALTIWGVWRDQYDMPKAIMMSAWRDRLAIHGLVERVAASCKRLKVDRLLIEAKASGISVSQEMQRLHAGEGYIVQLVDPKGGDKVSRAYSIQHLFADEMIYAPDREWADMVQTEMASFPRAPHDDLVDSVTQALKHLRDAGLLVHGSEMAMDLADELAHRPNDKPLYPV